ncbi:hypothetical protein MP228_001308 [Amoeboaphelidium protococcarum]|nr:hypothetical protein MP228_001308 [Amoeboaphelidium protococcarum]
MQLSLVSVGNCLPDGSLQLTKDQFYRACDSIMLRVRNFLVGHPSDSINRENFDRYLVIMFCLLAEIDEVAERIGAQKSVVLTLSFNAGCQHMLFSRKAFLGCEDPVLSREEWFDGCFDFQRHHIPYCKTACLDMHSWQLYERSNLQKFGKVAQYHLAQKVKFKMCTKST